MAGVMKTQNDLPFLLLVR